MPKISELSDIMLGSDVPGWQEELKLLDALIENDDDAQKLCQMLYDDMKDSPRRIAMGFIHFGWNLRRKLGDSLTKKGD
jgi:hypothetical protein